jgi:hypothetical protein
LNTLLLTVSTEELPNILQLNLYTGSFHNSKEIASSDSFISFHKDGPRMKDSKPIFSFCVSNSTFPAEFRICHESTGEEFIIPQCSGSGYFFGGRNWNVLYKHAKVLKGCWNPSSFHLSITCGYQKPWKFNPSNKNHQIRGIPVHVDWNQPFNSRVWCQRYIAGSVSKGLVHPQLLQFNSSLYWTKDPEAMSWQPGDVFHNFSTLQLLHLHPVSKNQGVGGKQQAVSLVIASNEGKYQNSLQISERGLTIWYESSLRGEKLLQTSFDQHSSIRVFLHCTHEKRQLFPGPQVGYLFIGYFFVIQYTNKIFMLNENK